MMLLGVPCGEYLWNHANGTMLRQWIIDEFLLGPTGLGSPYVDGFYVDDGWANTSQPIQSWEPPQGFCDHWVIGGATEEDLYCVEDMGLTQDNTTVITDNWQATMQQAAEAIQANNGWGWYMFTDVTSPSQSNCESFFQGEGLYLNTTALLFQWTDSSQYPLPNVDVDVATFMLVRGDYAWLGYSWLGCTGTSVPGFGGAAPYTSPVDIPALLQDYGVPVGPYTETLPGVFQREWTKGSVSMDCNTYTPQFVLY